MREVRRCRRDHLRLRTREVVSEEGHLDQELKGELSAGQRVEEGTFWAEATAPRRART